MSAEPGRESQRTVVPLPLTPGQSANAAVGAEAEDGRWPHHLAVGAVILLALAAYSNSFTGTFVFDDIQQIRDNVRIRDLGAVASWSGYLEFRHRYVGYFTLALNYALGRLDVADYHVVNFGIHAANAALVYALALLIFRTPRLSRSTVAAAAQSIAFLAAALFATHPIQTQAVTYIVQRFTSLATLFYLLTIVLFLRWRLDGEAGDVGRGRRAITYVGMLVSVVLAMKTKEIAVTAPLAVVLCELSFFEPLPWRRRLFLVPILATLAVIPLTFLTYVPLEPSALGEATRIQTGVSRLDYLLTQASVVLTYLELLVWPAGQNLDHDFPLAKGLLEVRVILSVLGVVALAGAAALLHRRTADAATSGRLDPVLRLVPFGVGWFFLALVVESSVIPIVDVIYEHRVYLPSVGIFIAAAGLAGLLFHRIGSWSVARALLITTLVLSTVLGVATFRRNRVWANDISLWTDAAEKSPGKSRPHLNLGTALAVAGRIEEGARELRRAVELDPGSAYARAQLGAALLTLGRLGEAEPELRETARLEPDDPEVLFNLAMVLMRTGRKDEAKQLLKRFLEVAPTTYADARRYAERVCYGRSSGPSQRPADASAP